MAKRKNEDAPFGDEYQQIIEQNKRRKELGVDEYGERIKVPSKIVANKSGNAAKKASTQMREATSKKRTARQTALKKWREEFKRTGQIPASPTR